MQSREPIANDVTLDDRYRLEARLGQGCFGVVYEAFDEELRRPCAVRVLGRDERVDPRAFALRFFSHGARLVRLNHAHAVAVYDYGRTGDDRFFVAMEPVRGRPLSFVLSDRGPLAGIIAASVCERVCSALEDAHRLGIVHGQIAPDRVWLTGRGLEGVKLSGLGHVLLKLEGQHAWPIHALRYAPPELLSEGLATPQGDVYGVGALLFELLTGQPALSGETTTQIALAQAQGISGRGAWYERLCHTNPMLAAIVARCLSANPGDRYESIAHVRHALARTLHVQAA
jgi:serine/threonine-protein kinase